ncbi:hypothetical protein FBEOM_12430 [Fusarium beomiforme]|uniref:Uncharacterized protein n=1 Tax=Fusarium beomiforme TaxID=44412 RepID=A0A9P5A8U8_9HYPO|nr:hypothetical protein FBEOM_12430 [Fusarium beomiforme]
MSEYSQRQSGDGGRDAGDDGHNLLRGTTTRDHRINLTGRMTGPGNSNISGGANMNVMEPITGRNGEQGIRFKGEARDLLAALYKLTGGDIKQRIHVEMFKDKTKDLEDTAPGTKRYRLTSSRLTKRRLEDCQQLLSASKKPAIESKKTNGEGQGENNVRHAQNLCAGCGAATHQLKKCLQAGPDGLMRGCPKCITPEHSFAQCRELRSAGAKRAWLVDMRRNMPAFQDVRSWAAIVSESVASGATKLTRYPWTPAFTITMAATGQISELQAKLDAYGLKRGSGFQLPADPLTKSWEAVEKTCASASAGNGATTQAEKDALLADIQTAPAEAKEEVAALSRQLAGTRNLGDLDWNDTSFEGGEEVDLGSFEDGDGDVEMESGNNGDEPRPGPSGAEGSKSSHPIETEGTQETQDVSGDTTDRLRELCASDSEPPKP